MNKIIILIIISFLVSCTSNSQNEIEIITKKTDLPLKILFGTKKTDSTYIYLCFPKRIIYNNKTSLLNKLNRYNINLNQVGTNSRDYRWYRYKDSLIYPDSFQIEPFEKDSIDFYYGYSLKLSNFQLDSLINSKKITQIYGKLKVYDIPISDDVEKWASSKINDSIKGQLHFKLHNKEKGFFYKSLDIELFDD
ncbi:MULTISPECIES: hypothetical protein [Aquimarina]|uniref:hypothetical protein n=1 Tax=Aquimarina TaxID=290174 RepID=UPI000CDEAE8B|nr:MULTISPECIES: hypothetical protein [Aquimarina]